MTNFIDAGRLALTTERELSIEMSVAPKTKLVEVRLSALTRVEFMEVVEVPADVTQDELNALVNMRYSDIDGDQFTNDPEYWERGSCYAIDSDMPNAVPTVKAIRANGSLCIRSAEDQTEQAGSMSRAL